MERGRYKYYIHASTFWWPDVSITIDITQDLKGSPKINLSRITVHVRQDRSWESDENWYTFHGECNTYWSNQPKTSIYIHPEDFREKPHWPSGDHFFFEVTPTQRVWVKNSPVYHATWGTKRFRSDTSNSPVDAPTFIK